MDKLEALLEGNRNWAARISEEAPDFLPTLAQQQTPDYLWIGCADSRVPANEIVDMLPGDIFVHRNVANLVIHTDMNCLSVLQYAVEVLKVKHIMVVGHYGCGGVRASLQAEPHGLIDNWLRHIRDLSKKHREALSHCRDEDQKVDRMCELNAVEQAYNVCDTTIVQEAWGRGQELSVYALVYGLEDGLLQSLKFAARDNESLEQQYQQAVTGIEKLIG